MTRRQLIVSLSVPTIVAALGAAALVVSSSATGTLPTPDAGCAPGSECCRASNATGASEPGNVAVTPGAASPGAAAAECGPGACCVPSCCGGAATPDAR